MSYCDEAQLLISDFENLLARQFDREEAPTTEELVFSAKKISGMARRAENAGVDLRSKDGYWLGELKFAARVFVASTEVDLNQYTDDELERLAKGILERLDAARDFCTSAGA